MNEQEKNDWMVCVRCYTYNHAPYIEDALNGFAMQETDFPFVCTIVDDASTDGEQKVIKNYLNENFELEDKKVARHEETDDYVLFFSRHKTNKNCYFAVCLLKYNHYSIKKTKFPYIEEWDNNCKYIAICEGDDYWINPNKLQIQVDVLEQHKECSICICGYVKKSKEKTSDLTITTKVGFSFDNNYHINNRLPIQPVTWLRRKSMMPTSGELQKYKYVYDIVTLYLTLEKGNGYYIPDICCVYRYTGKGVFSQLDKKAQVLHALKPRIELCKFHPKDNFLKKRCAFFYSSYIFYSILNKQTYFHIDRKVLGFRWLSYSYLRAYCKLIYSRINPSYKRANLINSSETDSNV